MLGKVVAIFISAKAGAEMEELSESKAIKNKGLEGDRYAEGLGAFSKGKPEKCREISLISEEAIAQAGKDRDDPFTFADTRRNIIVSVSINKLNDLLGKQFKMGEVVVEGTELCHPCARPSKLSGKEGFREAFENKGGLRVKIIAEGIIRRGDVITLS